jgi:hypothetical protein
MLPSSQLMTPRWARGRMQAAGDGLKRTMRKMGVPRVVDELRETGFPVPTIDKGCGVTLVQPIKNLRLAS